MWDNYESGSKYFFVSEEQIVSQWADAGFKYFVRKIDGNLY
jgi:hypothetical protein